MAKSKKEKRQKYIQKILKDNKVSKKEVQKAAKKGIRLDRIQKAARKSTEPGNVFSRPQSSSFRTTPADIYKRGGGQPAQTKIPTPAAPVIRPGAQTLINRDIVAREAAALQPQTPPTPQTPPDQNQGGGGDAGAGVDDMGFDTSYYDDLIANQDRTISDLNMRIGDLTTGFQTQLGEMTAAMQEERAQAARDLREMQGSFTQAMAQRGNPTRVQGIRFADRGTGGATQAQLQRRGVRGTFGRRGERLMKISSLNV